MARKYADVNTTVDEFVKTSVLPEHQEIVAMLRSLMRESAPNAKEMLSYNMPVYKGNGFLAWILPSEKHIIFSFKSGVKFEDKYHLLKGVGKHARHVKIKDVKDLNKEALRYYIKQALEHDE